MDNLLVRQLNIELVLSGICALLVILSCVTKMPTFRRKVSMIMMDAFTFVLLMSDRFAYLYDGDPSSFGYIVVRVSNFLIFAMTLLVMLAFNIFLKDLYKNEGKLEKIPFRLELTKYFGGISLLLLIISQYAGFYYTFDESNFYHRASLFSLCYLFPMVIAVLQMSVIIQYRKRISSKLYLSIVLFTSVPTIASLLQIFLYGLSLINITLVGLNVVLYVLAVSDLNDEIEKANLNEIDLLKQEQQNMHLLFVQTAEALVNAIDAKDKYTHGHSTRVAEYSQKIAQMAGMNDDECEEVYFAALLHDVGKIGVSDNIINKEGKLTEEEFKSIKDHTIIGKQILSGISRSPYLRIGANYHHERYDGRGYPEGLKGEDIPAVARIISVADAYDAMTSKRSYRDPIPQQRVREEIVKNLGTQFDPKYGKIMVHLIDLDSEFEMKEREEIRELAGRSELLCGKYRTSYSEGILITRYREDISFKSTMYEDHPDYRSIPSLIVFDSLDGRIHADDHKNEDMIYFEYCVLRLDGEYDCIGARKIQRKITEKETSVNEKWIDSNLKGLEHKITAVRRRDHMLVTIDNIFRTIEFIIALPDCSRYSYIALSGEHCSIEDVAINRTDELVDEASIPRIAEEVSYINVPEGDIPNVQIDGWRSSISMPIPIKDHIHIDMNAMSLPTSRLIWHCPFISIYTSEDGSFGGEDFTEFALIRLDGESWESDDRCSNKLMVRETEEFENWNIWKKRNKAGVEVSVQIEKAGNEITVTTYDAGIEVRNVSSIDGTMPEKLFAAITGDQCAITNIRIR